MAIVPGVRSAHGSGGEAGKAGRSEEHTSELQSLRHLVCRLLLVQRPPTFILFPYTTLFRSHRIERLLVIKMAQRVSLAVSPSRRFCNFIRNISPVERETVDHGHRTRGQECPWQWWGSWQGWEIGRAHV